MKQLIAEFFDTHSAIIRIAILSAKGSTPREEGAFMLVAADAIYGTVGGGRLELDAIATARKMLAAEKIHTRFDVSLGPDINQCCGGRVALELTKLDHNERLAMTELSTANFNQMPDVLVFGAGHVGRALALALAPLPFRVTLIDTRAHALLPAINGVFARVLAAPEQAVREAKPGASYVVMTHEHSLDFLIANEALKRNDAFYVGLIGSKTKKAVFRSQFLESGGSPAQFETLVCPIGANVTVDKRPEVIAAFVAAELCNTLLAPKS
jgi:xanthine dehydrogenase accessory factor